MSETDFETPLWCVTARDGNWLAGPFTIEGAAHEWAREHTRLGKAVTSEVRRLRLVPATPPEGEAVAWAEIAMKQAADVERLWNLSPNDSPELQAARESRVAAFRGLAALALAHPPRATPPEGEAVAKQMRHRYEASLWTAWYEWTPEKDAWAASERETYGTLIVETRDLYTHPPRATVTEAFVARINDTVLAPKGYGLWADMDAETRAEAIEVVSAITAALAPEGR